MTLTLGDIATMLDLDLEGDPTTEITGVSGIEEAGPGEITFVANPKYETLLHTTQASAVILGRDVSAAGQAVLRGDDPYLAFGRLLRYFAGRQGHHTGHHPNAVVAPTATVHESAALHAGVVVEGDVEIGPDCVIYPGVYLGARTRIGVGTLVYSNVVIREDVQVGDRVIFHSGVVIGACGPAPDGTQPPAGSHVPSVAIEDDVELGAHTTVDRGYARSTRVGRGSKVDNLVHIGAEAQVGPGCLVVAQVGIGAGADIGEGVTLAGQSTILPNVRVGARAIITAKAGVDAEVPPGKLYSGSPARPHEEQRLVYAALRRLPRSRQTLIDLQRRLSVLEGTHGE